MDQYKEGQFRMDFENTGRANRKRRIFLDTETTGMSQATDRIVEVCASMMTSMRSIAFMHLLTLREKCHGLSRAFMD